MLENVNKIFSNNSNTKNGITLIALIVTIIVLMILVGITIALLNNKNGIINKVDEAQIQNDFSQMKELVRIQLTNKKAEDIVNTTQTDLENMVASYTQKCFIKDFGETIYIITNPTQLGYNGKLGKGTVQTEVNKIIDLYDVFAINQKGEVIYIIDNKVLGDEMAYVSDTSERWEVSNNTITAYKGDPSAITEIVFPNYIDGQPIKRVGNNSEIFGKENTTLQKISFANGIQYIGENAFYKYSGLKGPLVLPDSLIEINTRAFAECRGLTGDLIIPDKVTTIKGNAFYNCRGFDGKLVLSKSLKMIAAGAFYGCTNLRGDLVLPDSLQTVQGVAFNLAGFDGVIVSEKGIVGDNGIIRCNAYRDMSNITGDLKIAEGTTKLENYSCSGNFKMKGTLEIPSSVKIIEQASLSLSFSHVKIHYKEEKINLVGTALEKYDANKIEWIKDE